MVNNSDHPTSSQQQHHEQLSGQESGRAKVQQKPFDLMEILVSLVIVGVISIAASHAPARIKLLGLFPLVVGLVIGFGIGTLISYRDGKHQLTRTMFVTILSFVGLVSSTWLTFQREAKSTAKSQQSVLAESLIKQMEKDSGNSLAMDSNSATQPRSDFSRYLAARIKQIGNWSSPWPEMIWILELICGTIGAIVGLYFSRQFRPTLD
ncbi:MAG: hypothetical protein FJ267_14990 [Planctomycetes bacterium]|nr:hypothetical protein [Planctomycetota bacterium]